MFYLLVGAQVTFSLHYWFYSSVCLTIWLWKILWRHNAVNNFCILCI